MSITLEEFFKDERFVSSWSFDFGTMLPDYTFPTRRHGMVLHSGLWLSVQASSTHYSAPRENQMLRDCYYWKYEIGFPSEVVEELLPYAEDPDNPTDTVYGYVPIEVVEAVIEKHGGIDIATTLAKIEAKKQKQLENKNE